MEGWSGLRVFLFSVDGYNLGLVAPINPQDIRTSEVPCASSDWPILENRKTLGQDSGSFNCLNIQWDAVPGQLCQTLVHGLRRTQDER